MIKNLPKTKHLLRLTSNVVPFSRENFGLTKIFSSKDEGTIQLTQEENTAFYSSVKELMETYSSDESVSKAYIDTELRSAIFYVVDLRKRNSNFTVEQRIDLAINILKSSLSSKPEEYIVYLTIEGWKKSDLPRTFGNVRFTVFSEYHIRLFKKDLKHHILADDDEKKYLLNDVKNSTLWKNQCAILTVKAKDSDAALSLAKKEVRLSLDCISWFLNFLPYIYTFPFLTGDSIKTHRKSLVRHSSDHSFSIPGESVNKGEFSLEQLANTDSRIKNTYKFISSQLRKRHADRDFSNTVINACRWFGIGERSVDNATSFLCYVIGLESILLPDSRTSSQRYRITIRLIHLIGTPSKSQGKLKQMINKIYKIRNNVVHNGEYHVSTSDLNTVKYLAQFSIIKLSTSRETKHFKSRSELDRVCSASRTTVI